MGASNSTERGTLIAKKYPGIDIITKGYTSYETE